MKTFEEVTPGYWYMKTDYRPGYTIVDVMIGMLGDYEGRKLVYSFGHDDPYEIEVYSPEQFICEVPKPD